MKLFYCMIPILFTTLLAGCATGNNGYSKTPVPCDDRMAQLLDQHDVDENGYLLAVAYRHPCGPRRPINL